MPSKSLASAARTDKLRVGILLSGSGRTLQNFLDLSAAGELPITVAIVIASRGNAYGLERAQAAGVPTRIVERRGTSAETFSRQITEELIAARVELVCLAGFLSLWHIPLEFTGKVMNIHPALLPDFGGKGFHGHHVHRAVLAADCTVSGCTVHFADNEYDHGPIILQRTVPVLDDDTEETLAARVFEQEKIAYPEAIRLFAANRLRIEGDGVRVLPADQDSMGK